MKMDDNQMMQDDETSPNLFVRAELDSTSLEEHQKKTSDESDIVKTSDEEKIDSNVLMKLNKNDNDNLVDKQPLTSIILPVREDPHKYNMNYKNRGKCIIFNHEKFESRINNREGSSIDVNSLKESFSKLEFKVEIKNDLCFMDIKNEIEKLSQYDYTDDDCLCIIVLTHGQRDDLIWAKDAAYSSENIWKQFTADKCKTLIGKPKLIFIQACRGNQVDKGEEVSSPFSNDPSSEGTDNAKSYKIPTHADFLIAHSSVKDFYSWRNPNKGTWYIQCLCEILNECGTEKDLMSMLTLTARKVAIDCISYNPKDKATHNTKQMPSVTTMLTGFVYFPPKSNK